MASAMQPGSAAGQPMMRLAGQLHSLSELTETLAFRLLELEERLASQERQLESLLQPPLAAVGDQGSDTELRLGETEERLERLEALLNGLTASADSGPPTREADPFPEDDGEQPFMDELETPDYLDRLSA